MNEKISAAAEKYVNYAMRHFCYGILEEQQKSRININVIEITHKDHLNHLDLKHVCFYNKDDIFIRVPAKFLVAGERVHHKKIRELRYQLMSIETAAKFFGNTIDIFVDGNKIIHDDVYIALFDNYFVVELPEKYRFHEEMYCLIRPHVYEITSTDSIIKIPKRNLNATDNNDFLVYVDGYQTNNYTIIENENEKIINVIDDVQHQIEITFMYNLEYYGKVRIDRGFINIINKTNHNFPIPNHNILTFANGKFKHFTMNDITDGLYAVNGNYTGTLDMFLFYKEYDFDDVKYQDQLKWFLERFEDPVGVIDDYDNLPTFAKEFSLLREPISLIDYVRNKYKSLDIYHVDKVKKFIKFCEECLPEFAKVLFESYSKTNSLPLEIHDKTVDKKYLKENTRISNFHEIKNPDNRIMFSYNMIMFSFSNPENYPFNIYVDGNRNVYKSYESFENGVTYVYLDPQVVKQGSFVSFEVIKTNHTESRFIDIVYQGGTNIIVSNISNITSDENDIRFLNIAIPINNEKFNPIDCIKDRIYDKEKDQVLFILKEELDAENIRIYNHNFYRSNQIKLNKEYDNYSCEINWLDGAIVSKNHLRVYKNGKEVPRSLYDITMPDKDNDLDFPLLTINCKFATYEQIDVVFTPIQFKEIYTEEIVKPDGIIDIFHKEGLDRIFLCEDLFYFTLNGKRITKDNYKIWCSKGMSLNNVSSNKHFSVIARYTDDFEKDLEEFVEIYVPHRKKLDEYIMTLMYGSLYDEEGNEKFDPDDPPVGDTEKDISEKDPSRIGFLYYDLYNEFLRLNIIDANTKMPEYIILKYGDLIEANDIIRLDANMTMPYYMPLDATKTIDIDANVRKVLDLYYGLINDIKSITVIEQNNIPEDLYYKYKELFDKNGTLILQIPKFK